MDEKSAELLRKWDLAAYVEVFKKNEVDYDGLIYLPNSFVEKLFSGKLGPTAKFQRKLQEHLATQNSRASEFSKLIDENGEQRKGNSLSSRNSNLSECDGYVMKVEDVDLGIYDLSSEVTNPVCDMEQNMCGSPMTECNKVTVDQTLKLPVIFGTDISSEQHSTLGPVTSSPQHSPDAENMPSTSGTLSSAPPNTTISSGKPTKLLTNSAGSLKRHQVDVVICSPEKKTQYIHEKTVKALIYSNCIGRALLKLPKNKPLEQADRVRLCHEIVVAEVGADGSKVISAQRFQELAEGIVALFPEEMVQSYFIPRVPAQGTLNALQPKGILYDKYHNLLKYLRKTGLRTTSHQESRGKISQDLIPSIAQDIQWLEKHSANSQAVATEKWLSTVKYRIACLQASEDSIAKRKVGGNGIHSYMLRFACLTQNWGPSLLLQDFQFMYGGKYTSLIGNWPSVYLKLLRLSRKKETDIGPGEILKCLKLIPAFFNQPILISNCRPKRQVWKPNALESSQGFVLYVQTLGALELEIERMKEKCQSVNKTMQPFPAFVGKSENNIEDCYVVIDNLIFPMESPLVAVDTCFKIYHSLHCLYPVQSSYSWLFFQQAVYNFKTEWDLVVPAVTIQVKAYNDIDDVKIITD